MRRGSPIVLAFVLVFFFAPVLVDAVVGHHGGPSGRTFTALFFAAMIATIPAIVLLGIAGVLGFTARDRPRAISELVLMYRLGAAGCGFFALALTLTLIRDIGLAGAVYPAAVLAYAAFACSRAARRVDYRVAIVARATASAAFALVSDPANWPRYAPQIEAARVVQAPIEVGTTILVRTREGSGLFDSRETVTIFEPGRRFGTTVHAGTDSQGVYDLAPVGEGVEVAYTHRALLTLSNALLTGALRRKALLRVMMQRRLASLEAIKRLLEGEPAANV